MIGLINPKFLVSIYLHVGYSTSNLCIRIKLDVFIVLFRRADVSSYCLKTWAIGFGVGTFWTR